MKLHWKPILSACVIWAGSAVPSAFAQQQAPNVNAEVRIVTRTIDSNGNVTEQETILQGQDALNHINQNAPMPNGAVIEEEIEVIIENENGTPQQRRAPGTEKEIRIEKQLGKQQIQIELKNLEDLKDLKIPDFNGLIDPQEINCTVSRTSCDKASNRPVLGVSLMQENEGGAIIEEVMANTAAQAAGLQKGDKIVKINGQDVKNIEAIQQTIRQQKIGDVITIDYERNGSAAQTTATLKASEPRAFAWHHHDRSPMMLPEDACRELEKMRQTPLLGVYINTGNTDDKGALVNSVINATGADKAKLKEGDRITQIDNAPVRNYDELHAAIQSHDAGDRVRVTYEREGKTHHVRTTLSSKATQNQHKAAFLEKLCDQAQPQAEPQPEQSSDTPNSNDGQRANLTIDAPATLDLFPNPAKDMVNVTFKSNAQEPIRVSLTQLDGKALINMDVTEFNGTFQHQLDLTKFPAGAYLMTVTQGKTVVSKQVVVGR